MPSYSVPAAVWEGQLLELIRKKNVILEEVFDFLRAAMPWIAVQVLLAVFCARGTKQKKEKHYEYNGDKEIIILLPLKRKVVLSRWDIWHCADSRI